MEKPKYLLKLIIIGDPCTGKSAFFTRYVDNEFIQSFIPTIGVDFVNNIFLYFLLENKNSWNKWKNN